MTAREAQFKFVVPDPFGLAAGQIEKSAADIETGQVTPRTSERLREMADALRELGRVHAWENTREVAVR